MAHREDDEEGRRRPDRWPRRSHDDPEDEEWYEPRVMDFARKIVRQGAEVVWTTQGALREKASGVRNREIPKELVESVAHITTRTKDELVGLMAREFKSYLEKMDLAGELRKVAENYTLDVNMKIRLRPHGDPLGPDLGVDPEDEAVPEDEDGSGLEDGAEEDDGFEDGPEEDDPEDDDAEEDDPEEESTGE